MSWKEPPTDQAKNWVNRSLELQITLACSWDCQSCDALSQFHSISFNKRGTMTIAQIERFIGEMKSKNAYIGRIRILGGEPTGHNRFQQIVEMLHAELVPNHILSLEVITNGDNPEKCAAVKHLARIRTSGEGAKQKHHVANLVHTPATLGYEAKACSSPWHCGISLSYYGYWPCSAGAGLSRMRDWMHHQRLELPLSVNWQWPNRPTAVRDAWPDLELACAHCCHALHDEDKIKSGTGTIPGQHALNVPSADAWQHLAPWIMQNKQPSWPVYGQGQLTSETASA